MFFFEMVPMPTYCTIFAWKNAFLLEICGKQKSMELSTHRLMMEALHMVLCMGGGGVGTESLPGRDRVREIPKSYDRQKSHTQTHTHTLSLSQPSV